MGLNISEFHLYLILFPNASHVYANIHLNSETLWSPTILNGEQYYDMHLD